MEEKNDGKGIRGTIGKAVRAGAAYGVLAGGAYGAYQLVATHEEARCQEPAAPRQPAGIQDWSSNPGFEAQTRLLKILYAAYDRGNARVRTMRQAVDETYEKARADLGKTLGGAMDEKVAAVEILPSGAVAVTLSYAPAKGAPLERFPRARIRYQLGLREPTAQEELKAKMEGGTAEPSMDVRILSWEAWDEAKKDWAPQIVPADMQPTMRKAAEDGAKPDDCAYPRWNPQGIRYGFLDRGELAGWYD
jgi:hypothetical protein